MHWGRLRFTLTRWRNRSAADGQVFVIFAVAALVLIGFVALSVDAGYLMAERRQAQNAADAGALAGAKSVQRSQQLQAETSAIDYVEANGFTGSGDSIDAVYPADPAPPSPYLPAECVFVEVTHDVQKFFVGALYTGDWKVGADAWACTKLKPEPYALITLDPDGDGIKSGGNSDLTIVGGGAMSNSDADICGTASWISADGPLDAYSNVTICSNASVDANPIRSNSPAIDDPLSAIPEPTMAQCGANQPDPNIGNSSPASTTISPGKYTNGITVNAKDKELILSPGLYCFGQDFKANAGSTGVTIKGSNVTLYFYGSSMLNIDGGGVKMLIDSPPGGTCSLAACNAEIVVFYSRTNCAEMRLVGGNGTDMEGIFYAPCSLLHLGGGSGSSYTGQIIVAEAEILGGSAITLIYDNKVATEVPRVFLVE
ncbi:MAG TPA: Tad domain-containing protein [Thermomicrobiales bacterium]|nr:Tad domain-containing protein [Thermomicrobiales bacterium]